GTQLIEIGVKAVIVAGWAVDDEAALDFTETFYDNMFEGYNFGESVKRARKKIFQDHGHRTNTWGAYQCYGDPFYNLRARERATTKTYDFIIPEEAEIELSNMLNRIDIGSYNAGDIMETIQSISKAVDSAAIRTPQITTMEAYLYSALNRYDMACSTFEKLIGQAKARYHVEAMEKYCNVRPKLLVEKFRKNSEPVETLLAGMDDAIEDIQALLRYGQTAERNNLLGSAYKRKSMILKGADKIKALKLSAEAYMKAYDTPGNTDTFYSLVNWASIANAMTVTGYDAWGSGSISGRTKNAIQKLFTEEIERFEKTANQSEDIDYWNVVALANLKFGLAQLLLTRDNADEIFAAYRSVWGYVGHMGNRQAEMEHIDFLQDMLTLQKKDLKAADIKKLDQLRGFIGTVRTHLEALKG
ncbi:MAG: CHAT domain-containing protein, partial [Sphingobacteriales bacterium]